MKGDLEAVMYKSYARDKHTVKVEVKVPFRGWPASTYRYGQQAVEQVSGDTVHHVCGRTGVLAHSLQ